jgi:hypothetical protein
MGPTLVFVMGGFWRYGNLKSNEFSAKTLSILSWALYVSNI